MSEVYDPLAFFRGGDGPRDPKQRRALRLIAGLIDDPECETLVAFVGEQVVTAATDRPAGIALDLSVTHIDRLIARLAADLRDELGPEMFDDLMEEPKHDDDHA